MKQKQKDLMTEIASRANYGQDWAMMQYLPNPDPVLKRLGKDIAAYREILSDAHVGGCVRRRKAAIKTLEWRLSESGHAACDAALAALFARLPVHHLIGQMLNAPLFGYQPLEVMWMAENGYWLPQSIVAKPAEWFRFDRQNQLRFRSKTAPNEGELLPAYKFLVASHEADYNNPYGRADLGLCFWAALFKKGGFKYWLKFIEKYGSPFLVGKLPRAATVKQSADLLEGLESLVSSSVATIPDDASVAIVESAGKAASSEAFECFLHFCRSEISIALLGQNQTTEAEANRASAVAGMDVTRDIRDDDARIVEACFNQLITWVVAFNFSGITELPVFELYEQESVDKLQAERDELLSKSGARFSNAYFSRTYQLEEGDLLAATSANSAQFAEVEEVIEPEIALENAAALLPNTVQPWQAQILKHFEQEGPERALDQLAVLYPALDDTALTEQLARMIFVSEMYGKLTAKAEQ